MLDVHSVEYCVNGHEGGICTSEASHRCIVSLALYSARPSMLHRCVMRDGSFLAFGPGLDSDRIGHNGLLKGKALCPMHLHFCPDGL
jgi:hypothetical protein